MSTTLYKAVCARLLQVDFTERINICCLCLGTLHDSGISIHDEVVLQIPNHPPEATTVAHIINFVMDKSITDIILELKSVCKKCMTAAINSYKFIQCCRDSAKAITAIVDNLEESVDQIRHDTIKKCNSLYIAVEANKNMSDNYSVKRYFDKNRLFVPQDTAFLRFMQIIENDTEEHNSNDTTQMAEIDESLRELMCCKKNITTSELLNDPDKPLEYKCKVCKEVFTHNNMLRVHFFRVHRNKKIKCKKCSSSNKSNFSNVVFQQRHKMTDNVIEYLTEDDDDGGDWHYDDDVPLLHKSELVESSNNDNENMLEILKDISEPVITYEDGTKQHGMFTCKKCKQKFSTHNRYIKHIMTKKYKCKRPPPGFGEYKCDYCGYTAFYKVQLSNHIRFEHLGEKGYVCEFCGQNYYTANALSLHTLSHTKEKRFICKICGRKYGTKYGLKLHSTVHTDETPFSCHVCAKKFRRRDYLSDHFRRHHEHEPARLKYTLAKIEKYQERRKKKNHEDNHMMHNSQMEEEHFEEITGFRRDIRWFERGEHYYIAYRKLGLSTYLRCHTHGCPVTFVLRAGKPGPLRGEHAHPTTPWVRSRNLLFQSLKRRASSETIPLREIYQEEAAKYPDAAPHLPFESVSPSLRVWRQRRALAADDAPDDTLVTYAETLELPTEAEE